MYNKIDLREVPAERLKEISLDLVDIDVKAPEFEPNRQFYFMAKARDYVKRKSAELGRPMTFFTQTFGWAMLDTEHENCSISIVDISETDYNDYLELLKQEGFSIIEEVSEEIEGQDYVSIGTLLSNGEKGLSISYIPDNFTIYISFLK